jgi:hypothetical protein
MAPAVRSALDCTRKRAESQSSDEERSKKRARTEISLPMQVTAADFRRIHLVRRVEKISEQSTPLSRYGTLEEAFSTIEYHFRHKQFAPTQNSPTHLRTPTYERQFECTICEKRFVCKHDLKRHREFHFAEKKFVCKGELKLGGHWGCGQYFPLSELLRQHIETEAGRICTKPLLDEELILMAYKLRGQQQEQQTQIQDMPLTLPYDLANQLFSEGGGKLAPESPAGDTYQEQNVVAHDSVSGS